MSKSKTESDQLLIMVEVKCLKKLAFSRVFVGQGRLPHAFLIEIDCFLRFFN